MKYLFAIGLVLAGLLAADVRAQVPAAADVNGRPASEAPRDDAVPTVKIRRAPLDAIVVFTVDGNQQIHLPGWRLEQIESLLLKDRKAPSPTFVLQEIAASGKIVGNRAETEIRLIVTTVAHRSVLVPLGLKEGVLPFPDTLPDDADPAVLPYRYVGPGSMELTIDPQTGNYLALIHPPPGAAPAQTAEAGDTPPPAGFARTINTGEDRRSNELRHELTFTLWFPLTKIGGDENRLAVSFPQAVGSQFTLSVPMKDAVATVTPGAILEATQEGPEGPITRFRMLGLKSDFEITWRQKKTEAINEQPVLTVEDALIIARMETKSTVYDVSLPIRSRTVGFERVRIQLPHGTSLDHESTERYAAIGGYSFGFLAEEQRNALTPPANEPLEGLTRREPPQILEIRLPRKTVGPVNVRFKAVQQDDSETAPGNWRNLGGFEVREAARQTGQLGVIVPPNMRPNWSLIRGVRRSETGTSQDGVDARFDFFSQSFLLRCKFVSPETKINVQPEYQVRINKGSLDLTARFSYVVSGSKTEKLSIDLPGWQWTNEISPAGIVDSVGVEQDENGMLTIPLRTPMDGAFEIELKAYRPVSLPEAVRPEEGRHRLVVPLPQPAANWIKRASVVIVPADNVEVLPTDEEYAAAEATEAAESTAEPTAAPRRIANLSRRSRRTLPVTIEIPDRQQEPLFYETEPGKQVFVADIQYHRQKIAASMLTEIRLRSPGEFVTQSVSYEVSYVPVERLYFLVPKTVEENGALTVRVGGKPLELRTAMPGPEETVPDQFTKKILQLPEAMFKFQVVFDYAVPPVTIEHDQMTIFSLSFIRPLETQLGDHRVNMTVPTGFRIELDDEARLQWMSSESETAFIGTGFRTSQSPSRISLWISTGERDALGTTVVERAWLQTWLTGTTREDRGVFHVTSDRQKSVTMRLPPEAVRGRVFVKRDGEPILPEITPQGELTIPLAESRIAPVQIEVIYRITPFEASSRIVTMELPHFVSALVRSEYWQIILPQNRHIVGIPAGWTPEYEWAWTNGLFWGRVPSLTKSDVGFEESPAEAGMIPTESNQYLFSSLHPPMNVSICILDRSLIVLFSSGLALLIGLTLIYFPRTRYAGSLLGLAVALVAMTLYRPAPVLLMLQASSLGVLLALGASYVYRILNRDEKWVVPKTRVWEDASQPPEVYSVIMDEESNRNGAPREPSEESRD